MGLIEKLLPDTIPLTEEQFQTFLEQTVLTEHSRRILDGLTAQNAAAAPAQDAGTAAREHLIHRQDYPYNAGGRCRRECGARVMGLRSEAGGEDYPLPGLVGHYCSIPVEIFSWVGYNEVIVFCRLEGVS